MIYSPKIVLKSGPQTARRLGPFVEKCVADGVKLIAVVGDDCAAVEDAIDQLLVGDGTSTPPRFILTSSHPADSLDEAVAFARSLWNDCALGVQIVEL